MTNTKFTSGPWRLQEWPYLHIRAGGDDGENNGETVFARDYAGIEDANAHLIAAAPDLYEALAWAMHHIGGYTARTKSNLDHCDAVDRANAALSKARGERE